MTVDTNENVHVVNARALMALSEDDMKIHFGDYAVLVCGEIISFHKTNRDAIKEARKSYAIGAFSVQRVEPQPVELGFADCANYPR